MKKIKIIIYLNIELKHENMKKYVDSFEKINNKIKNSEYLYDSHISISKVNYIEKNENFDEEKLVQKIKKLYQNFKPFQINSSSFKIFEGKNPSKKYFAILINDNKKINELIQISDFIMENMNLEKFFDPPQLHISLLRFENDEICFIKGLESFEEVFDVKSMEVKIGNNILKFE
jgi:hypothetical protein